MQEKFLDNSPLKIRERFIQIWVEEGKEKGLTEKQFAKKIGISPQHFWKIMNMKIGKLKKLKCKRCDHSWIPRKEDIRICPRCKSYLWDKEKE